MLRSSNVVLGIEIDDIADDIAFIKAFIIKTKSYQQYAIEMVFIW